MSTQQVQRGDGKRSARVVLPSSETAYHLDEPSGLNWRSQIGEHVSIPGAAVLRKLSAQIRKQYIYLCLTLVNIFSIALTFQGPYTISYVDGFYPPRPSVFFFQSLWLWNNLQGSGIPNGGEVGNLNFAFQAYVLGQALPPWAGEAVLFFVWLEAGTLGFYLFCTATLGVRMPLAGLLGSIFYMYNPWSLIEFFSAPPNLWISFVAFLPAVLYFLDRMVHASYQSFNHEVLLVSGLFWILTLATPGIQSGYEISGIAFLGAYTFVLLGSTRFRRLRLPLTRILVSVGVFAASSAYWLWLYTRTYVFSPYSVGDTFGILRGNSAHSSPLNVLMLLGENQWYSPEGYQSYSYASFYQGSNPFAVMAALAMMTMVFVGVMHFKKVRYGAFFAVCLVTAVVLDMGSYPPFGVVDLFLVGMPSVGWYFRSPYQIFGWIQVLGYAVFVAFGLQIILDWLARYSRLGVGRSPPLSSARRSGHGLKPRAARRVSVVVAVVLILMAEGVYSFPFWTGQDVQSKITQDNLPSAREQIPQYYYSLSAYLSDHSGRGRVLDLPSPGILIRANWPHGTLSPAFLWDLSATSVYEGYYEDSSDTLNMIRTVEIALETNSSKEVWRALYLLGVGYVLVRFDSASSNQGMMPLNVTKVDGTLKNEPGVTYVKTFGKIDLFSVNPVSPLIYSASPEFIGSDPTRVISKSVLWTLSDYEQTSAPSVVDNLVPLGKGNTSSQAPLSVNATAGSTDASLPSSVSGSRSFWNTNPLGIAANSSEVLTFNVTLTGSGCAYPLLGFSNTSNATTSMVSWHFLGPSSGASCPGFKPDTSMHCTVPLVSSYGHYLDYIQLDMYSTIPSPGAITLSITGLDVVKNWNYSFTTQAGISFDVNPVANLSVLYNEVSGLGSGLFIPLSLASSQGSLYLTMNFTTASNSRFWPLMGYCSDGLPPRFSYPDWSDATTDLSGAFLSSNEALFEFTAPTDSKWCSLEVEVATGDGRAGFSAVDIGDLQIVTNVSFASPVSMALNDTAYDVTNTVLVSAQPPFMNVRQCVPPQVSGNTVSPSLYEVAFSGGHGCAFIVFTESFDPSWQIVHIIGNATVISKYLVNGYATGFLLDLWGSGSFEISYEGQNIETELQWVAVAILSLMSIVGGASWLVASCLVPTWPEALSIRSHRPGRRSRGKPATALGSPRSPKETEIE